MVNRYCIFTMCQALGLALCTLNTPVSVKTENPNFQKINQTAASSLPLWMYWFAKCACTLAGTSVSFSFPGQALLIPKILCSLAAALCPAESPFSRAQHRAHGLCKACPDHQHRLPLQAPWSAYIGISGLTVSFFHLNSVFLGAKSMVWASVPALLVLSVTLCLLYSFVPSLLNITNTQQCHDKVQKSEQWQHFMDTF